MASLPSYVELLVDGFGHEPDPGVQSVEMERGPTVSAVVNSQVRVELSLTLAFKSKADVVAFETWWLETIERVGAFDMTHPLTGATISANFKGGAIGKIVPRNRAATTYQCATTVEYMR